MPDIGDIHDMRHIITEPSQCPDENVFKNVCSEISDMRIIIDSRAASVESDFVVIKRFETLKTPTHGVEEIHFVHSLALLSYLLAFAA
jgi:hypothetical protein